ncbi:hypothetical protein HK104_000725 [Borealophlyctis nickersoniae]|nr:hypothetical protein HK104_000725 [Borealophlyctis nickersoniae]
MGDVAPFIDPDVMLYVHWFFFIGTCLAALLIMFPSFVSARADGKVAWSWAVVAIPLFIVDFFAFVVLVMTRTSRGTEEDEDDEDEFNEDRNATQQERERRRKKKKIKSSSSRVYRILCFLLVLLFQIFIVLRLDGKIDWSWAVVFAPWFVLEALNFASITRGLVKTVREGVIDIPTDPEAQIIEPRPLKPTELAMLAFDAYSFWILRIAQLALLAAKVDGAITAGWGIVFLPTWIWGATQLLGIVLAVGAYRRAALVDTERKSERKSALTFGIFMFIITSIFLYVGMGLLVKRLQSDNSSPSTAVIFIPLFIILGLIFCCVCCCLPCLFCTARKSLEAQLTEHEEANVEMIPSGRRITFNGEYGSSNRLVAEEVMVQAVAR